MERIKKIISQIKQSNKDASLEHTIDHILARENNIWANWKEAKACNPFEILTPEEIQRKFEDARAKVIKKMDKGNILQPIELSFRKVSKSKTDKLSLFGSTSNSDFQDVISVPVCSDIPENIHNPTMGELLERVFRDLDPSQEIEKEFRAKSDPV